MPRPPSFLKTLMARLEREQLARRPPPVTERERRQVPAPLTRAWRQWDASTAQDEGARRALYVGYSQTYARWERLRATRQSVLREEDPSLYALWPAYPAPCRELSCGARTRRGTPCKRKDLYGSGRCPLHGGLSTGPRTPAGKARSASNGHCPKRHKRSPREEKKTRGEVPYAQGL